ncbi:unnamed protein product [Allacma fusca]|uniref:Uncharacterized protein n=1 Tax=Allacma fusca TaxID=39272 RepID=A0A8J2K9Q6_9HEXA|nr:unnamed protein product [Allacma fusca]
MMTRSSSKNFGTPSSPSLPSSPSSPSSPLQDSPARIPTKLLKRVNPGTPPPESHKRVRRQSSDDTPSIVSVSTNTTEGSVQPMAIHKIILERSHERHPTLIVSSTPGELSREEQIIYDIVGEYNQKHKPKPQQGDVCYQVMESNPIELPSDFEQFLHGDNFSEKQFMKVTLSQDCIIRSNHVDVRNTNFHIVWFFYRPGEIFALTTNQAWRVVQKYSDHYFPRKIATRLCTEEGPKVTEDRVLIGEVIGRKTVCQIGKGTNVDATPVLRNSYTAEIRPDASILKLPCFTHGRKKYLGRTCIEFGVAFVRFKLRLRFEDIPLILDHVSLIARGEKTWKFAGVEETDASIYQRSVVKVPPKLSTELEATLVNCIYEGIMTKRLPPGCYIFSYRNSPQSYSSSPDLYRISSRLGKLPVNASLSDVFDGIRLWMDWETVDHALSDIQKHFKVKPVESESKKINWLDFVEAEMFHEDQNFWRIRKTWCTVQPVFIIGAHAWFKEFLKTHLVTDDCDKHLTFPWKNSDLRRLAQHHITNNVNKYYIDQYNGKEGYFLPPTAKRYLFDILYFDKSKPDTEINIYFVSSDFNSQTAEVSLRISRCREEILLSRKQIPSGYFYTLFQESFKNDFDEIRFKEMLFRCNFIYALAHTPDKLIRFDTSRMTDSDSLTRWMKRSFLKERDAPAAITTIHILRLLRKPGCPLLFKDMERVLEMNPLEGPDCEMRAEYTKKIFAVMTQFQPQYASLGAKLELKNLATTKFLKTCFKIYEIEGE